MEALDKMFDRIGGKHKDLEVINKTLLKSLEGIKDTEGLYVSFLLYIPEEDKFVIDKVFCESKEEVFEAANLIGKAYFDSGKALVGLGVVSSAWIKRVPKNKFNKYEEFKTLQDEHGQKLEDSTDECIISTSFTIHKTKSAMVTLDTYKVARNKEGLIEKLTLDVHDKRFIDDNFDIARFPMQILNAFREGLTKS